MPKTTINLVQPIHPTPGQIRGFAMMQSAVRTAHLAVHHWLYSRSAGQDITLLDAALAVTGQSLPPLPHWAWVGQPSSITQRQLLAEFRSVRDQLGWQHQAPASALTWAAVQTLAGWRGATAPAVWPPGRPPELHVGNAAQPIDLVTLELACLGEDRLIEADLFLLPARYQAALWQRQNNRLSSEAARLRALEHALYDQGNLDAATPLLRLRARYAAAGLNLDDVTAPPDPPPGAPECSDQVIIRQAGGRWELVWTFHEPHPRPRWDVDDVLGIDPGQTHTWAYASGTLSGVIPRAVVTGWALPPAGQNLPGERRARALARHAVFTRMQPGHEQLLALALRHRIVALEAVQWRGFRWRHNNYADYAGDSGIGIRAVMGWLNSLAPLHGVEVMATPARFSTRTCSRCSRLRSRPGGGRPFRCVCGHCEASDLNAARNHRQWALAQEKRRGRER